MVGDRRYANRARIVQVGTFNNHGEPVAWEFDSSNLHPALLEGAAKDGKPANYCRFMGWSYNDLRQVWHRVKLN